MDRGGPLIMPQTKTCAKCGKRWTEQNISRYSRDGWNTCPMCRKQKPSPKTVRETAAAGDDAWYGAGGTRD